jgi:magnesium transporter
MSKHDPFNVLHGSKTYSNEPPGTIAYTGHFNDVAVFIERIEYNEDVILRSQVNAVDGPFDEDKVYWFNVIGLHDINLINEIGKKFSLHHMDLEDIVQVSQWSKIEVQDQYLFSIFKMMKLKGTEINHEHLAIVQKDNVVITFQETPEDVFDEVRERLDHKLGRIRSMGSNYLFYILIDALVDQYFTIVNKISSDFIEIEMKILDNDFRSRERVYHLRKELLYLSNAILPIKDSVASLIKTHDTLESDELRPYYNDLLEHVSQVSDSIKAYMEMTNSLHEMNMSNASNEMNKTMMTLTIFSVIFIPLTFLTGVFGMNFTYLPGLDLKSAFYVFVAACVLIAAGMLIFFKMKKWN